MANPSSGRVPFNYTAHTRKDNIIPPYNYPMVVGQQGSSPPSINPGDLSFESGFSISVDSTSTTQLSATHTLPQIYPSYDPTPVYTPNLSPNFLSVSYNDTASHSAPASPSKSFRRTPPPLPPPLILGSPILQHTSHSTSDLKFHPSSYSPSETHSPLHPSTAPESFLQPPRLWFPHHRRTPTTVNDEHPFSPRVGRRRTSSASCESFFVNTGTQPLLGPDLSPTNYRDTSPLFSDTSPVGSPAFSGHDHSSGPSSGRLSSANSLAGVEIISSGGQVSPNIEVVNFDSATHFYHSDNSPVTCPDFSPSIGSASPSGSISVCDLNLGRSLSASNSLTNLSDVGSDFHSPLNNLFSLESYQYQQQPHQPQQQQQQFSESELCVDGNTSNYSLDNSAQRTELQQHQDVDRPQRQRVPSFTLTPADGVAPGTPPGSMLFSTGATPDELLGHDFPNLTRNHAMPLTGSPSEQYAMREMAYWEQTTGYQNYAIDPSTLSSFPSQANLSSGTTEPLYTGGFPNPADENLISSSGYSPLYEPQLPTFQGQTASSSSTAGSLQQIQRHISPEQALKEHTFEDKQKVYQILATSSKRTEVTSRIRETVRRLGRPQLSQIFDWASLRRVKLTPASEEKARLRRRKEANFQCTLCEALLTTNNNLQNHYRSHLCLNPYRCERCGKVYRTDGSLNRHVNSSKGTCPRRKPHF